MRIINLSRGLGKSSKLVKLSSKTQIPIVCSSFKQREYLLLKAEDYGVSIPTPLIFLVDIKLEDLQNEFHHLPSEVYVDDIDSLINLMFSQWDIKVKIGTISAPFSKGHSDG